MDITAKYYLINTLYHHDFTEALTALGEMQTAFEEDKDIFHKLTQKINEVGNEGLSPNAPYQCFLRYLKKNGENGNLEDLGFYGMAMFHNGSSKDIRSKGFDTMEKAAVRGYAELLLDVAVEYLDGTEVKKDEAKGFSYLLQYVQNGKEPLAYYALGHCYIRGIGVKKDAEEGYRWFRKGMEENHPACMVGYYGEKLLDEMSTKEEKEEALKQLKELSSDPDYGATALSFTGSYYLRQNQIKKAIADLEGAVSSHVGEAMVDLALAYSRTDNPFCDYQARDYLEIAFEKGFPDCEVPLMTMYIIGRGGNACYGLADMVARRVLQKRPGDLDALPVRYYLDFCFSLGKKKKEALSKLSEYADKKNPMALYLMGEYYLKESKTEKALNCFEESLKQREDPLIRGLYLKYYLIRETPKEDPHLLAMLEEGMKYEESLSFYLYGSIHELGIGVKKDPDVALEYHQKAADLDDIHGCLYFLRYYSEIRPNQEKYFEYIHRCCELGDPHVLTMVGSDMIESSDDAEYQMGVDYLKKACYYGSEEAKKILKNHGIRP